MNYLENPICVFKPLWDFNPSNKQDIFCSVFFKMKQHYKNFEKYMTGLRNWIEYMNEIKYDFKFRLFIDQNVLDDIEIMKLINSCPRMQPVLFVCADYIEDNYYLDLFGTLIRYFPMFDFPYNDSKRVFIVDIDFSRKDEKVTPRMNHLIELSKTYKYPLVTHTFDYALRQFYEKLDNTNFAIISNSVLFPNHKYDRNIILNFIKKAPEIKDLGTYGKRTTPFGFGVDELFLNKYFIQYTGEKNMGLVSIFYPSSMIWHLMNLNLIKNKETLYNVLKNILGSFYNKNQTIEKMFDILDDAFYASKINIKGKIILKNKYEKNKSNTYFAKRFYTFLNNSIEKKYDWIDLDLQKFILKYQNGIIASILVGNYNFKKNKVDKIVNLNTISI